MQTVWVKQPETHIHECAITASKGEHDNWANAILKSE